MGPPPKLATQNSTNTKPKASIIPLKICAYQLLGSEHHKSMGLASITLAAQIDPIISTVIGLKQQLRLVIAKKSILIR
jgi:hypothetical protein